MKRTRRPRISWAGKSLALLGLLLAPAMAPAQNCALCYTQAAGAGERVIQALRSGILVLVFPPMAICIGITIAAYRKRNRFNEDAECAPPEPGAPQS
ncbi:MAG: hypothetical protein LAN71_13015 [Acidobacteriia bacterium]|nr:hypothetical protein [Terriglobia bacterium]